MIRAFLRTLGQACSLVASEYHDLARIQRDGSRPFQVLLYLRPMSREQARALRRVIGESSQTEQLTDLPVALRRRTLCILAEVPAPTADAALVIALAVVRSGLHDIGIELDECHVEVEPGTRAEWQAA